MKTQIQNSEKKNSNKFLLTGCFLLCTCAGWLLGSITTDTFSQSHNKTDFGMKKI